MDRSKRFIHKNIRVIRILYLLLILYLFGTVLYDSFKYDLPFYYILFFAFGRLLGWIFNYTQILRWDEIESKVVKIQDKVAVAIFIGFILFRTFVLPTAVDWVTHPHFLSDALFLISAGVFYSGIRIYSKQFNELLLQNWLNQNKKPMKDDPKSDK